MAEDVVSVDWSKLSPHAQAEIAEIIRREGLATPVQERKIQPSGFRVVAGPALNMRTLPDGTRMPTPKILPRSEWGKIPTLRDPR